MTTLKDLRLKCKYPQTYIADLLQIKQSAYSMIETGQRGLTIENAKILAKLYNVDWWLFFETEEKND
jgi:transcriptional regulator with XRE-family HTH domain